MCPDTYVTYFPLVVLYRNLIAELIPQCVWLGKHDKINDRFCRLIIPKLLINHLLSKHHHIIKFYFCKCSFRKTKTLALPFVNEILKVMGRKPDLQNLRRSSSSIAILIMILYTNNLFVQLFVTYRTEITISIEYIKIQKKTIQIFYSKTGTKCQDL